MLLDIRSFQPPPPPSQCRKWRKAPKGGIATFAKSASCLWCVLCMLCMRERHQPQQQRQQQQQQQREGYDSILSVSEGYDSIPHKFIYLRAYAAASSVLGGIRGCLGGSQGLQGGPRGCPGGQMCRIARLSNIPEGVGVSKPTCEPNCLPLEKTLEGAWGVPWGAQEDIPRLVF